jgi:hypothetical protein
VRGVVLWVGARILVCLGILYARGVPGPMDGVLVLAGVAVMAHLDARRRGETVLLGNLAVPPWVLAALPTAAALPLEAAFLAALP